MVLTSVERVLHTEKGELVAHAVLALAKVRPSISHPDTTVEVVEVTPVELQELDQLDAVVVHEAVFGVQLKVYFQVDFQAS